MKLLEKKMYDLLCDLKENYAAKAVKIEFETEYAVAAEIERLIGLASSAGLDFTLKIGGCACVRDILDAKSLGIKNIVAPMIESRYAMEKFVKTVKNHLDDTEFSQSKLYINLETLAGVEEFDDIAASPYFERISGVVFGRSDFTASIWLENSEADSQKVFEIAEKIAQKTALAGKELVIGGNVTARSMPFFKKFKTGVLSGFETRKIIFDAPSAIINPDAASGIQKALEFELHWLKNKNSLSDLDKTRIETLEKRFLR